MKPAYDEDPYNVYIAGKFKYTGAKLKKIIKKTRKN
jgi:hypothetical protein